MHAVRSNQPTTPGAGRRSGRPWIAPFAVGGILTAGTVAIVAVDPSDTGVPVCLSRSAFGIDCPLCGGLRCVNALARGDLFGAADHNVVLALVLPLTVAAVALWLYAALTRRRLALPRVPAPAWVGLGAVLLAFTIARNVGGPAWIDWLAASGTG